MYPRILSRRIGIAREDTPVVLVQGARQVGKTTLVTEAAAGGPLWPNASASGPAATVSRYLTLDDVTVLEAARADPTDFVARYDGRDWTVIDEVQRAPKLLLAIKKSVDDDRRPGRFLVTGSSNIMAFPGIADVLPGRMAILNLWPLAQAEIESTKSSFLTDLFAPTLPNWTVPDTRPEVIERARAGGYPNALERAEDRRSAWFSDYLAGIIGREVRGITRIGDDLAISRVLEYVSSRAKGPMNLSDLAAETGYKRTTASRYLDVLRQTFLVTRVPAWGNRSASALRKSAKFILSDSGLASFLLRAGSNDDLKLGSVIEQFVGGELHKHADWNDRIHRISYYRTNAGDEVDYVVEGPDGKFVGVEVKLASGVDSSDFKGLRHFAGLAKGNFHRGVVLYTGRQTLPFAQNLFAVPIAALWRDPTP